MGGKTTYIRAGEHGLDGRNVTMDDPMTNDAERVSDIVPTAWRVWSEIRQGWMVLEGSLPPARHTKAEPLYTADIIEAQSKALAEAKVTREQRIAEVASTLHDYIDIPSFKARLLAVAILNDLDAILTPTPENPNG